MVRGIQSSVCHHLIVARNPCRAPKCVPHVGYRLSQWEELKLHFELTKASEHYYMAYVLHHMDKTNYVYLTCLKSILSEVQVAVKSVEGEQTDPVKLLDSLVHLLT